MTKLHLALDSIYAPVQTGLDGFSRRLKEELYHPDTLMRDVNAHLLKMTGKFLRPALVFLTSRLGRPSEAQAMDLALAVELIHTATLVHDDIIDGSDFRRNQPSVFSKWGREISIISGDYLYARAFMLIARLEDVWFNKAFSACARVLCEGEMRQVEKRSEFLMSEEEYLDIIERKTAALFRTACAGGAYLGRCPEAAVGALDQYGRSLGMAFQIVDDCLDLVGDSETLGKKAGLDLDKNDITLPILYLFQGLAPGRRQALEKTLKENGGNVFSEIKSLAVEHQSVERAMQRAHAFTHDAMDSLKQITASRYKDSLADLAHYNLERVR